MFYYELKKILSRKSGRMVIFLICAMLALVCYFAVYNPITVYVDENGQTQQGYAAARKLRAQRHEWAGKLTTDAIARVIEENARINEEAAKSGASGDAVWGKKRAFDDISAMINKAFCKFREYDYYKIDSLSPDDAAQFYDRRVISLTEWLDSNEAQILSDDEKAFLTKRYMELEAPIEYDYMTGWEMHAEYMPTVTMLLMLLISFPIAGIFSGEKQLKADAVFFSSYYGRGRAVLAKLMAGIAFVTAAYWAAVIVYSAVVLGFLGADGAGLMVQIDVWKSFYNITFFEQFLLMVFGGYIGCLSIALLEMLVATKTKSAMVSAAVPFVLIFLPTFISGLADRLEYGNKILGLLPDQLFIISQVLSQFNLYKIGSKMTGAVEVLFPLYIVISLILVPTVYFVYRNSEVQ